MKKLNSNWFTLIELLISITIFLILTLMTYVNYAFYQNIAKVKLGLKEVSQSINEARNMAINGFDKNQINQSIWVFFDLNNKNIVKYYWFNFNSTINLSEENILKERKLQEKVWIEYLSGKNNIMIYFSSIYWVPSIYYFDESWNMKNFDEDILDITLSFNSNNNFPFKRELKYFKNTNVVDY